ncbi:MAG: hypothetical protein HYY07_02465, partial [Elusimicrobia bacterium]|nr:hypothetical protein [Elusimicrobiota bacterium]
MESNLVKKLVEDAPAEEMGMAELLAQEEANSGKESLLMAKAISVIKEGVLVDTGKKTEALIPRREFGEKIPFKAGDTIPVMKVSDLRQDGFRTVSWKAARDFLAWQEIEKAHLNRVPIRARVLQQIRGG